MRWSNLTWTGPTFVIAAALLMISFAARAATYTFSSYPAGLAEVSCEAFKKNVDGSWTQVAILIAGGQFKQWETRT